MTIRDLTNKRFGRMLVVSLNPIRSPRGCARWDCVCDCGVKKTVLSQNLIDEWTKSCGCLIKELRQGKSENSLRWKGVGQLSAEHWHRIKIGAQKRQFVVDINPEDAWNLFLKQDSKCALSGVEIYLGGRKAKPTASLDRIDSAIGYTASNVQWVHRDINLMKNVLSEERFIELCQAVAEHRRT